MSLLFCKAYLNLIRFDRHVSRGNFAALYERVREYPVASSVTAPHVIQHICSAVDLACIWYRKEVLCLQRSAATACLLRKHGVNAQLVIGAQQMPARAHAWVEVDGRVVNDKPYMLEIYAVLDRC
jgi:hypothetical protein